MATLIRNNFTGGELSPALHLRPEMTKYQSGLRLCENFLIRPQGGMYSRPGTNFCGEVSSVTDGIRLIPFVFSTTQTYVLVFSPYKIEIIRDGAFLTSGGSRVTVVTPYSEAQLQEIDFAQSADVMTLVHPGHTPRQLSRLGETNWQLTQADFSPPTEAPEWAELLNSYAVLSYDPAWRDSGYDVQVNVVETVHSLLSVGDVISLQNTPGMSSWWDGDPSIRLVSYNGWTDAVSPRQYRWRGILENPSGSPTTAETSNNGTFVRRRAYMVGDGGGSYKKTYRYVVTAVTESGEESLPSEAISTGEVNSMSATYGARLVWTYSGAAKYFRVYKEWITYLQSCQ